MDYFEKRNQQNVLKIRKLQMELPDLCREFFLGISNITSTLTRLNYAYDLRIFFDYLSRYEIRRDVLEISLDDLKYVTATQLECFLDYLNFYEYKGKTYKNDAHGKARKLSTVKTLFRYFYAKDKLPENVASKISMPKMHEKPILRLENDEVEEVLDFVADGAMPSKKQQQFHNLTGIRDTAILTLFLGTGIRISELVGLDINDLDFKNNSFTVTRKGGARVILYFPEEVANTLSAYIAVRNDNEVVKEDEKALFLSLQNKRISVRAVENLVNKYCRLISPLKKITPHKLRSTYGTNLYRATKDIYVVAEVLGHKDVNTTKKHYAATSDDIRKEAAEKIKLHQNQ